MRKSEPRYQGYIFDLDGTIYLGDDLIPGAKEVIAWLRRHSRSVLFLSNKPLEPSASYAAKLTRLGIPAASEDVLNSTRVLVHYLRAVAPQAKLFVVGEDKLQAELTEEGFQLTDQVEAIDIVVASFDRTLTYGKLNTAYQALVRGARFLATNADSACPVEGGTIPDCAGVIAFLEATSGRRCEMVAGKPSSNMLQAALQRLGVEADEALMVGDRLATDILMGVQSGLDTALVLSGVTTREALGDSDIAPVFVLDSVRDVP